ncbi:MAG: tRNA pseudouridine(38-40) synthase TruA [Planctomycetes bacterium]|nr:tRNA pseudouridine(38-40) synthase TruA [Planctomycetota bacterium]
MRNLRLIIAYDGTAYHGWQFQPGLQTVEGTLRDVLSPITQTSVTLIAAGRTDAGVHARGQVANFRTESPIDVSRLRHAANSRLPDGIIIRAIDEVGPGFHATHDALGKHYRYSVWADREKPPYDKAAYTFHFHRPVDLPAARGAARLLVGQHDFKAFEGGGGQPRQTTVRTIRRLDVRRQGPEILFDVEGDGFLYNMVRNLVGTLLEVARGHWTADAIPRIVESRDRRNAGPTAPAHGLTLWQVFYDEASARGGLPGVPGDP